MVMIDKSVVARAVPFDNATNGFTADEVQSAIEEARDTAPGKARATMASIMNGTVGADSWLGHNELVPGDTVPFRIPWNCTLEEVTVSFPTLSVDGAMVFYKNGTGAGQIVFTETFTNVDNGKNFNPNLSFVAGDLLRMRWTDTGQNPADMATTMFFLLT
jgi:hypothetical protein